MFVAFQNILLNKYELKIKKGESLGTKNKERAGLNISKEGNSDNPLALVVLTHLGKKLKKFERENCILPSSG